MAGKGAPKGNQFALGNKGGGRKTAFQEHQHAQALFQAFFEGIDLEYIEDLKKKIETKKGKLRLVDYMFIRALENDKVLTDVMKKIFADKNDTTLEVQGLADALRAIADGAKRQQPPEKPDK